MKYQIVLLLVWVVSCCAQQPFGHDVLLIINFNHPYYDNIPFLQELYGKEFPHIVFYGSMHDKRAEQFDHYQGWYSYHVVVDAMQKFPGYRGYLFLQDDCVMNVWNVVRYDKERIWVPPCTFVDLKPDSPARNWSWWLCDCGYLATSNAYKQLAPHYLNQIIDNGGFQRVPYGMADVFYIPASKKDDFIELSTLCFNHKVFLEIAVPFICSCLCDQNKKITLNVFYSWKLGLNNKFKRYKTRYDFVHPIKFSLKQARAFIKKQFAKYQRPYKTDCSDELI